MCELSELCELSPQDAVESLSVKSAVGGFGLFFGETQGLGRRYLVRVQPIQLFVKFDIVGSFWMFGGSAGGGVPNKSFVSRR
jgi:hypothetical protein